MKSYCLCCCFFLIRTYYFTQADDKLAIPSALQQELSNRPQSMKHPIGKQIAGGRPVSSYQTVVLERDGYVKIFYWITSQLVDALSMTIPIFPTFLSFKTGVLYKKNLELKKTFYCTL